MKTIEQFVDDEIIYNQTGLVSFLLRDERNEEIGFSYYNIVNDKEDENGDYPEVFSWYLVTDWLADKLKEEKEVVLETDQGSYWGRCTFGQLISMDSVIERIYKTL
jgi:hypothetical protein